MTDSVIEIGRDAFLSGESTTVTCPPDSYAWRYCKENRIPVKAPGSAQNELADDINANHAENAESENVKPKRRGFFGRLFGTK